MMSVARDKIPLLLREILFVQVSFLWSQHTRKPQMSKISWITGVSRRR